jgi:hypothetical protein
MEAYKIDSIDDLVIKPMLLYRDINNDTIPDKRFHIYRNIDIESSNEIFCISDIHADVHRFWTFLYRQGFVRTPVYRGVEDIVWNPEMKNKTIVVCGDLIDGRRNGRDNSPSFENNEIRLHWIIYNLRLDALQHGSYIFCTLGNHDFYAFHGTKTGVPYFYSDYIDTSSKENYISIFNTVFPSAKTHDIDKLYLIRTHILSRFYLIGFPFFFKINLTLFAHAGFHPSREVLTAFEAGTNSNTRIQPLLIHRMILESLADVDKINNFIDRSLRIPTYINRYNDIFTQLIADLKDEFDPDVVDRYTIYFTNMNDGTPASSFFLTRELQKNCAKVDAILEEYGCRMIVLGHCPTCLGATEEEAGVVKPDNPFFNNADIDGILPDCSNARIVYSCNSKLITVDIASSSGFSPKKDFLECLWIQKTERFYLARTIRYCLSVSDKCDRDDINVLYNHKIYKQ